MGLMPPGWSECPLEELLLNSRDLTYGIVQPGARVDGGVPIIRVRDIQSGRVNTESPLRVSPDIEAAYGRSRIRGGELLVTLVGTVGQAAVAGEDLAGWNTARAVAVARVKPEIGARWLTWVLQLPETQNLIKERLNTTVQATFNLADMRDLIVPIPPSQERRAIAATLGTLDDKIDSNRQVRLLMRSLGQAMLMDALAAEGAVSTDLGDVVKSVSRGVAPKYLDDDPGAPLVLNQRCIRGNWVTVGQARHMARRDLPREKRVSDGDILVCSTGTGTLGRVGRWHHGEIFADGHVGIVQPDADKVCPTVLAYCLFSLEGAIEDLATGSTGQTELSPRRLESLVIELPATGLQERMESVLVAFEKRAYALMAEELSLAALRDALLPELLSGRLRVS